MIHWLKKVLKLQDETDFLLLYEKGCTILDVRTLEEFNEGHIDDSVCIPMDEIDVRFEEISKMTFPIIACCRSGRRSGIVTKNLSKKGVEIYNGGGWKELEKDLMII